MSINIFQKTVLVIFTLILNIIIYIRIIPFVDIIDKAYADSNTVYYLSLSGSDANPGTLAQPFKTFDYALSQMEPGNKLQILAGTYNEVLVVNISGTNANHIIIESFPGEIVTFDAQNIEDNNIRIYGNYVDIKNVFVKNATSTCVRLAGEYITATSLDVTGCQGHGINVEGQHITVSNSKVYDSVMENSDRLDGASWSSGLKVSTNANDILLEKNTVYNNYGEGIAVTKAFNVEVKDNLVSDNFGVNIYVDNSYDVNVNSNISSCTGNPDYQRDGKRSSGIVLNEEYYSGWGAKLSNINILNNIVFECGSGIHYWGSDVPNGGLQNSSIINNTVIGTLGSPLYIAYESFKTENTVIYNNVFDNTNAGPWIDDPLGITIDYNHWVNGIPWSGTNSVGLNDQSGNLTYLSTPSYNNRESFKIPSTSVLIDKGKSVLLNLDFYGNTRPYNLIYDIGAIEYTVLNQVPIVSINALPNNIVEEGEIITLTANISGGDLPYTNYEWTGDCTGSTLEYIFDKTAGNYSCVFTVEDQNGDFVNTSISITVNSLSNLIPTIQINVTPEINVSEGTLVTLSPTITNGDLPYQSSLWSGDCNGSGNYIINGSIGKYNCIYTVVDANGDVASDGVEVNISALNIDTIPSISISLSPSNIINSGQTVTLNANIENGNIPYTSQYWSGSCFGTNPSVTLVNLSVGQHLCKFTVVDIDGDIVTETISFSVIKSSTEQSQIMNSAPTNDNKKLSVKVTINNNSDNNSILFQAEVTGGELPYIVKEWSGECKGNNYSYSFAKNPGIYSCKFTVIDAKGNTISDEASITIYNEQSSITSDKSENLNINNISNNIYNNLYTQYLIIIFIIIIILLFILIPILRKVNQK